MTAKKRRRRLTIASLMACVAALALLLALALPVLRHGPPPCLSAPSTARWLATRPGAASCVDCHGEVSSADGALALVPEPSSPMPNCPAAYARGPDSCISCHAN